MSVSASGADLHSTAPEDSGPHRAAALAAISHGTSSEKGRAAVKALAERVAALVGGAASVSETRLGHVDVEQPDIAATLESLPRGACGAGSASAVGGLPCERRHAGGPRGGESAGGCGANHGPRRAARPRDGAAAPRSGADLSRDTIILGGAGSSDTSAQQDVRTTAEMLADHLGVPVTASYLSFAEPTVHQAVEQARADSPGGRVAIASYLLAPGYFQGLLRRQGADVVAKPLLLEGSVPDGIPELVLDRFRV